MEDVRFYEFVVQIRPAILCLGFLIGIGTGVFLLIRKRMVPGILAIAGFVLFSLDPIANYLIYQVFRNQIFLSDSARTIITFYNCLNGLAFFLGSVALVAALYLMLKPAPQPPEQNIFPG